jgi:hypothetical protein
LRRRERLIEQLADVRQHEQEDQASAERYQRVRRLLTGSPALHQLPLHTQREAIQSVIEAFIVHPVKKREGNKIHDSRRIERRYQPWVWAKKVDKKFDGLLASERRMHELIASETPDDLEVPPRVRRLASADKFVEG